MIPFARLATLIGHEGPVYSLERSPREGFFFSGGSDRMVAEWSVDGQEQPKAIVNVGAIIYSMRLIAESNLLLIGTSSGHLHVVDLQQGKEVRHFTPHQQGIFDIQYDYASDSFFTASADGNVLMWRLSDFAVRQSIHMGPGKARSLTLIPDQGVLAAACGDGNLRILDIAHGQIVETIAAHTQACMTVLYDPSGKRLISGGKDAHLNVWDTGSWKQVQSIPAHNYAIYSLAFSPDGTQLATGSRDKTVKLWDRESLSFRLRIDKEKTEGHTHSVNKVLWLDQPDVLISAGDDRSVRTWKSSLG